MNNNDKFIELYNKLDTILREHNNISSRTISCIKRYEDELKVSQFESVRNRGFALESIRNVRNTLIHDAKIYSIDAFDINDKVILFLEKEIDYLLNPKRLIDIAVKIENVYSVSLNDNLQDVIFYLSKHKISHAPLLDENGILLGVFSESTLFSYLLKHNEVSITNDTKIKDFYEYLLIDNHSSERFEFLPYNKYVTSLNISLNKKAKHEKRIAMIFLTKTGRKDEKILGIMTSSDFININ